MTPKSTTPRLARRTALAAASAIVLVGAVGVFTAITVDGSRPADFDLPAVQWEEDSRWDGNEWVEAVRRSESELSYAFVMGDFTDPDLIAAVGYVDAQTNAWDASLLRFSSDPSTLLAQTSRMAHFSTIESVDIAPDGNTAMVATCQALGESEAGEQSYGRTTWWVRRLVTGEVQAAPAMPTRHYTHNFFEDDPCARIDARAALWSDPLDPSATGRDSVRRPLSSGAYAQSVYAGQGQDSETARSETAVPHASDLTWFDGSSALRGVHPLFDDYLDAQVAQRWAQANNDYSAPEVVAALGYDQAVEQAQRHGNAVDGDTPWSTGGRAQLAQAPIGMVLLTVEEVSATAIRAHVCMADPQYDPRESGGRSLAMLDITTAPDGRIEWESAFTRSVDWVQEHPGEDYPCYNERRTFGLWPTPVDTYEAHDRSTVMPHEREYYVDLGVIDE